MNSHTPILIIGHDRVATEALSQTLRGNGYTVHVVDSAQAALDKLDRDRSTLISPSTGIVITDQDAPGAGGIELIRRLHDDWPGVVPIMLSGYRKVESAVIAMRLGAADYLLKPIVEQELIDAVQRAEQRHLLLTAQDQPATDSDDEPSIADDAVAPPAFSPDDEPAQGWTPMPLAQAMKQPERRILLAALEANQWNRQQTAKELDINRTTLYKKIRQYRLDEPA